MPVAEAGRTSPEPAIRTTIAASPFANFGFRSISLKTAAIIRRCLPRCPMERGAERAGSAESDIERSPGDGCSRIRQQGLCTFDPPGRQVAVRRLAEGLLERSQEMIPAQSREVGQRAQGNVLCEMLFNEIRDASALPSGKSAAIGTARCRTSTMKAQQLVGQHPAERFGIHAIARVNAADLSLELEDSLPKADILEQKSRLQIGLGKAAIGIDRYCVRIDVQADRMCQLAWLLPAEEPSSRRDEDQLARAAADLGDRQPLYQDLAVVARTLLDCDEKVVLL